MDTLTQLRDLLPEVVIGLGGLSLWMTRRWVTRVDKTQERAVSALHELSLEVAKVSALVQAFKGSLDTLQRGLQTTNQDLGVITRSTDKLWATLEAQKLSESRLSSRTCPDG